MCHTCKHTNEKPFKKVSENHKIKPSGNFVGSKLDKYAQLGKMARITPFEEDKMPKLQQLTTIDNEGKLVKRKKRKFLSHHLFHVYDIDIGVRQC